MEWITQLGNATDGYVLINERLTIGKQYAAKEMHAEDLFFTWQYLSGC